MTKHLAAILIWLLLPIIVFAFPRDIPEITCLAILLFPLDRFDPGCDPRSLAIEAQAQRNAAIGLILVLIFGAVWFASGLKWVRACAY